jgi:glycosyltransferase involved in cell wall biosynthesis
MRLLWLAHVIPYPPKAGFLLRSYNLLHELAREHTVDLISFVQERWVTTLSPSLAEGLEESRGALGQFCRHVTFLQTDNVRGPLGKRITAMRSLLAGSSFTTSWLISPQARSAIAHQLSATAYDLVHFDTIGLASYRDLAPTLPATLTHHNIESHMMRRRAEHATNPIARRYFRHEARLLENFEKATASGFAAHITCSDLDSTRLRALVPNAKTITIPNGVDCEYFSPSAREIRPCSMVFVGTMDWYPNIDAMRFFLREVWPPVRARLPSATMDIAGSNPPESLRQLARTLPGVTIHGYVPDVRPLIDSAALYVCPIRDGGGTKLKILDAFSMKKTVLAHPIACEGIDIIPDKNVVLATTAGDFADNIVALLADDERRRKIGEAARTLVETQYSFRAIGAQFRAALGGVVLGHQQSG